MKVFETGVGEPSLGSGLDHDAFGFLWLALNSSTSREFLRAQVHPGDEDSSLNIFYILFYITLYITFYIYFQLFLSFDNLNLLIFSPIHICILT